MSAEDYIARYGHALTEAQQRYIRAFGPPREHVGPARNPSTPDMHVVAHGEASEELRRAEARAREAADAHEAADWGA